MRELGNSREEEDRTEAIPTLWSEFVLDSSWPGAGMNSGSVDLRDGEAWQRGERPD